MRPALRPLSTSRVRALLRRLRQPDETGGREELSGRLSAFIDEFPYERAPILAFVREAAAALPAGSRVLDAGAGDAPYRELFSHCNYVTADWPMSRHAGGRGADILASLEDLPVDDGSFDAVLSTQVLEHVPNPSAVLEEVGRILRPGGTLWLTAPLIWPLHEEPYDFYRYTEHGLRHLLEQAGFEGIGIRPRNGCLATLSQLAAMCGDMMGMPDDQRHDERRRVVEDLARLSKQLARLDELDSRRILPLGYAVQATRPL